MKTPTFDETRDQVLDTILNNTMEGLFPFLTMYNAKYLSDCVKRHLDIHLEGELQIVNGNHEPAGGYTAELAIEFQELRDAAKP